MTFSWKNRDAILDNLENNPPEVLILGGGIVGCATAAIASRMGLNVLLLEKEDIAAGASGNSTGLAHAGLRYLAQGKIKYVFNAGHERQRLQELAPHWTRPFDFILPVYSGEAHSLSVVSFGTRLYNGLTRLDALFSRRPKPKACRRLTAKDIQARVPGLRSNNLQGGMEYFVDAQLQDSRLTLGLAQLAAHHGGRVLLRMEAKEIRPNPTGGSTVIAWDVASNREISIPAKVIINATGAWIDHLRLKAGLTNPITGPSRGIHLVVDHISALPLIFSTEIPGKVFFVLPMDNDVSIVGTTDTPIRSHPEESRPDLKEVAELLQRLFYYFPYLKQGDNLQEAIANYQRVHVRHVYWGQRPLLKQAGSTVDASREHALVKDTPTLWSVPGVKLTSGISVGEEVAQELWKSLRGGRMPLKPLKHLPGGEISNFDQYVKEAQKRFKLGENSDSIIQYLVHTYGTRYLEVLQWANREPHYRERILDGEPWILAQVPYAIENEMVLTLNDLLWRRTKWALWRSLPDETVLGIAQEMSDLLHWSAERRAQEIASYQEEHKKHEVPHS